MLNYVHNTSDRAMILDLISPVPELCKLIYNAAKTLNTRDLGKCDWCTGSQRAVTVRLISNF
jgi:hypothetical protein